MFELVDDEVATIVRTTLVEQIAAFLVRINLEYSWSNNYTFILISGVNNISVQTSSCILVIVDADFWLTQGASNNYQTKDVEEKFVLISWVENLCRCMLSTISTVICCEKSAKFILNKYTVDINIITALNITTFVQNASIFRKRNR